MTLRIIYIKLSQLTILLPVIAGFRCYKQLNRPFRTLLWFFLATIGFEVQASVLSKVYHNNMPGLHLFTFIEFLAFSFIYRSFFRDHKALSVLIGVNALVFAAAALADAFVIHSIWTVNTLSRSYSSASMLCYTLIYYYFMFSREEERYTSGHPMFWLNTGALVYFGSNALYFMFNQDLLKRSPAAETIGLYFHAAFNIVANYLYAQSFRCFRPKTIS